MQAAAYTGEEILPEEPLAGEVARTAGGSLE
jgi:hypothetical protein